MPKFGLGHPSAQPGSFKIITMNKSLQANERSFTIVSITQANNIYRDGLQGRFVRFASADEAKAFTELPPHIYKSGLLGSYGEANIYLSVRKE